MLIQNRDDPWEAAGYLGMSFETLLKTDGHYHPDPMSARPIPDQIAGCTQPKSLQPKSLLFLRATLQPRRFRAAKPSELVGIPRHPVSFPEEARRTGVKLRPSARAR